MENVEHTELNKVAAEVFELFNGFSHNRGDHRWLLAHCGYPVILRFDLSSEQQTAEEAEYEFLMGMTAVNEYNPLVLVHGNVSLTNTIGLHDLKRLFPTAVIARSLH